MAGANKYMLAPTGSVGNLTGPSVDAGQASGACCFQFVVEAVGTTVTYKFQGSMDGVNWYDVFYDTEATNASSQAVRTMTAVGSQIQWLDTASFSRMYTKYRVVVSANTGCTFRAELYVISNTEQ